MHYCNRNSIRNCLLLPTSYVVRERGEGLGWVCPVQVLSGRVLSEGRKWGVRHPLPVLPGKGEEGPKGDLSPAMSGRGKREGRGRMEVDILTK